MAVAEQAYASDLCSAFLSRMLTPPQVTDENIELPQQCSSTFNLVQIYDVNRGKILSCFLSEMKWNVCTLNKEEGVLVGDKKEGFASYSPK